MSNTVYILNFVWYCAYTKYTFNDFTQLTDRLWFGSCWMSARSRRPTAPSAWTRSRPWPSGGWSSRGQMSDLSVLKPKIFILLKLYLWALKWHKSENESFIFFSVGLQIYYDNLKYIQNGRKCWYSKERINRRTQNILVGSVSHNKVLTFFIWPLFFCLGILF